MVAWCGGGGAEAARALVGGGACTDLLLRYARHHECLQAGGGVELAHLGQTAVHHEPNARDRH